MIIRNFEKLLQRAKDFDEEAVTSLYHAALPVVYRYVAARVMINQDTEDIVSEIFLVMVEQIQSLRAATEASFFAWILRIAHNKVIQFQKHDRTSNEHVQPILINNQDESDLPPSADLLDNPENLIEWREIVESLGLAISYLTQEQQIVVLGRFLAGQSIENLAKALHKKPGAIRAIQFRALNSLAEQLGGTHKKNKHHEEEAASEV